MNRARPETLLDALIEVHLGHDPAPAAPPHCYCTLRAFIRDNTFGNGELVDVMAALADGRDYQSGGGAAAAFTVRPTP